jgi:hypothetical protein
MIFEIGLKRSAYIFQLNCPFSKELHDGSEIYMHV